MLTGAMIRWVFAIVLLIPAAAQANPVIERLAHVLRIDEVVDILRDEGITGSGELAREMLGREGGPVWTRQIAEIHDPEMMRSVLIQALDRGLTMDHAIAAADFFETETGQVILNLEHAARRAMSDENVKQMAINRYHDLAGSDDPRLREIETYVDVNDLIELNVRGTMASTFQFMVGMMNGRGLTLDDEMIAAAILGNREQTEAETRDWVYGYLLVAYNPLTDAQMQANIAFSETEAGQALNTALFEGFDEMYQTIFYRTGMAVAKARGESDL